MHAMYALLGMRSAQRTLADVVVDPLRNVLYTLDLEGNMDLFDLGVDGNQTTQKVRRAGEASAVGVLEFRPDNTTIV